MLDPLINLSDRTWRSLSSIVHEGLHTLLQLLFLSLLLLGLGGLVFKAVRPGGWIESALGGAWNVHPGYALAILGALILGGTWAKRAAERLPLFNRRGDWLVYGCLALGAYFAIQLSVTGGL